MNLTQLQVTEILQQTYALFYHDSANAFFWVKSILKADHSCPFTAVIHCKNPHS